LLLILFISLINFLTNMNSWKNSQINDPGNYKNLTFRKHFDYNKSIYEANLHTSSPSTLSKLHRSNSFMKKKPFAGRILPENSNIQVGLKTERKIQPLKQFRNKNESNIINAMHKTESSWNNKFLFKNLNKKNDVTKDVNLPSISSKKISRIISNDFYAGNDYYINGIKKHMMGKNKNLQEKMENQNKHAINHIVNEEISNKSINVDGIIFEVSTRSDTSQSPVEGLEAKIKKQMNLQYYDFNGALSRFGSKSPSDSSINVNKDLLKKKQIQTSLNFFSSQQISVSFTKDESTKRPNQLKEIFNHHIQIKNLF